MARSRVRPTAVVGRCSSPPSGLLRSIGGRSRCRPCARGKRRTAHIVETHRAKTCAPRRSNGSRPRRRCGRRRLFRADALPDRQRLRRASGPGGSCWVAADGGEQTVIIALDLPCPLRAVVVESEQLGGVGVRRAERTWRGSTTISTLSSSCANPPSSHIVTGIVTSISISGSSTDSFFRSGPSSTTS